MDHTYINGADKVLVAGGKVGKDNTPKDGKKPRAKKSFPRFLGGNLDQWRASKGDATEIGKNVICNNHGGRQYEPDKALEDVVDDEVRLADDQEERHVGPGELGELELVVALLQGGDKKDEA